MALSSLRLRRTLSGLSTLHRSLSATSALSATQSSSPLFPATASEKSPASPPQSWRLFLQSRTFRSSPLSSARPTSYGDNQKDEIDPNTILFEGCDYNHWLIVMDYPRDNKPPAEEMIKNYEETCAKGLNISVEEAKKKMYACSTTVYTGFQVEMTEEESQKFEGLPGVVFVLPDSYLDVENKEYGGDKYINGTIIPRPPPVQYGRQQGGRFRDNNRNRDQQRYDQQRPTYNPPGNPSYNQQGPMRGGGNYEASQNYPQQNYSSPRQGENTGSIPVNTPGGRDAYQPGRDPVPSYQGNYNQGGQQSYRPQEQRNFPQGDHRNYSPPGQQGFRGDNRNNGPPHADTNGQGLSGFQGQGTPGAYGQGPSSGTYGQGPSSGAYGRGPSSGAYGQGPSSGAYGQGPSSGAYGQGPSSGTYGQGPSSGPYGQGTASGDGQRYPGHGGDERFQQNNYAPVGQTGIDQGKNY